MSQSKTQTATTKRINNITIKRMVDEDPDASYLEQEDMGFEQRLQEYRNGDFCFVGVRAEAEFFVGSKLVNVGCTPVQTLTSGGLWGIESDSDEKYFAEVEQEELSQLRQQLEAIGFSKRAVSAAFKTIERKSL